MPVQRPRTAVCRLCGTPLSDQTGACSRCGTPEPWIADEPTLNARLLRLVVWGTGIVLVAVLLFVSGFVMFGPPAEDRERGHAPAPAAPGPAPRR